MQFSNLSLQFSKQSCGTKAIFSRRSEQQRCVSVAWEMASHRGMKALLLSALLVLLSLPMLAGTPGSFRGTVVEGPRSADACVYVEGHDHSIRRVYVSGAKVRYDDDLPIAERQKPVPHTLPAGTQIRVTAEQDDAGEWHATEIEILKLDAGEPEKKADAPTTAQS